MKRYQIITRPKGDKDGRWSFVAHGAVWREQEGDGMIRILRSHGDKVVRKLAI